jgi:hypothetical protein
MCYSRATLVPCPPHAPLPAALDYRRACFIVRDANGQALAYVHFEEEPGRRTAAKLLTKDEARRMGVNFAQVPGLPLPAT